MRYIYYCLLTLCSLGVTAQINEKGFNFQGYARDFEGTALGNQEVTVKFSIYEQGQAATFVEEHTVTTDPFGLFGATIGTINTAVFYGLDWANRNYYLQVEVRAFGADFIEISNTALLSVPYAQAAGNGVPAGTILPFGGNKDKIPTGYVACDGSVYDQNDSQYAALFDVIGFNWGSNAGQFRVPDLRGYFLRGLSEGVNDPDFASRTFLFNNGTDIYGNDDNTGNVTGSYQFDINRSHGHITATDGPHTHVMRKDLNIAELGGLGGAIFDSQGAAVPVSQGGLALAPGGIEETHYNTSQTGYFVEQSGQHGHAVLADGGTESRPKNAYVLYIIKL